MEIKRPPPLNYFRMKEKPNNQNSFFLNNCYFSCLFSSVYLGNGFENGGNTSWLIKNNHMLKNQY